jgi:hypothetical protein
LLLVVVLEDQPDQDLAILDLLMIVTEDYHIVEHHTTQAKADKVAKLHGGIMLQ